jgi:hypothetical protein
VFTLRGHLVTETKFEKPKVAQNSSGVSSVKVADILLSRLGRNEINQAAEVAVSRNLRHVEIPSRGGK